MGFPNHASTKHAPIAARSNGLESRAQLTHTHVDASGIT